MPDPHERVGTQERNDLAPQRAVHLRVAKHGGRVHRDGRHEAHGGVWIVEQAVLQRGDAVRASLLHGAADAARDGRTGVVTKVVAVALGDARQQQVHLEGQQLALGRCHDLCVFQRYSHTRSSERSWSESTGLVM